MNKVDKPVSGKLSQVLNAIEQTALEPVQMTDCERLLVIKNQINQAYYDLCETCRDPEPGPAVCDLGNYAPKVE
jgi:hypothetical protein